MQGSAWLRAGGAGAIVLSPRAAPSGTRLPPLYQSSGPASPRVVLHLPRYSPAPTPRKTKPARDDSFTSAFTSLYADCGLDASTRRRELAATRETREAYRKGQRELCFAIARRHAEAVAEQAAKTRAERAQERTLKREREAQERAAVLMQRLARGRKARRFFNVAQEKIAFARAAVIIQSALRHGAFQRWSNAKARKRLQAAASIIQGWIRRLWARHGAYLIREGKAQIQGNFNWLDAYFADALGARDNAAATRIQAVGRARFARSEILSKTDSGTGTGTGAGPDT